MFERSKVVQQEEEILARWEREKIFEATVSQDAPKGDFVFYEGPPTANGKPGIHHVLARAFKDVIPRFKTMQGFRVRRKAGWDTHGLPVELEVEKKLGLKGKQDIETLKSTPEESIAYFNELCRQSVWTYKEEWERLTKRIGFWLDLEHPYITYEPNYVESLWSILRSFWEKGLLFEDYKVVPYCPRCGTPLSSHELALGYDEVNDPSIYVKFKIQNSNVKSNPKSKIQNNFLLVWTTTPWTLPANVALVVKEEALYVRVKSLASRGKLSFGDELILAKERLAALGDDYEVLEEIPGSALVGLRYEPLYDQGALTHPEWYKVWAADFVSLNEGTGIVHTAVAFGPEDFEFGKKNGIGFVMTVDVQGRVTADVPGKGKFVKTADKDIIADLESRGLLQESGTIRHSYPFCWRCETPLIYMARPSWYLRTTAVRDQMIIENEKIKWIPAHIRDGRFGEWLREVKDWAITRERYWGTPLPIWICERCKRKLCVGSFVELSSLSLNPKPEIRMTNEIRNPKSETVTEVVRFDPHRPYVDEVKLKCECGGEMTRVKDLVDVWFDSGAMPWAQYAEHIGKFQISRPVHWTGTPKFQTVMYPADYICEAIDQTRGWFYTLLAISSLLGREAPYKNVICLGHVLDAKGQKMSKSKGNVVSPWDIIEKYGADATRWYFYTVNQPGDSKRFDEREFRDRVASLTTFRNVVAFWEIYSTVNTKSQIQISNKIPNPKPKNILDEWLEIRLNETVQTVTERLEAYEIVEAARMLESLVLDLSTWWLRRSRERLKAGNDGAIEAFRNALEACAKLFAPFCPFLAENTWTALGNEESIHLVPWSLGGGLASTKDGGAVLAMMDEVRRVASAIHEARAAAKIPVRQPLAKAVVKNATQKIEGDLLALLAAEVNIFEVVVEIGTGVLDVALETTLTPELARAGQIRELTRAINDLRKRAGLAPSDRANLTIETPAEFDFPLEEIATATRSTIKRGQVTDGREVTLAGQVWKLKIGN